MVSILQHGAGGTTSLCSGTRCFGLLVMLVVLLAAMVEGTDLYRILRVDRGATTHEIKKAYRQLAREKHPDVRREEGAREEFEEIQRAYDVLSDYEKRTFYDRHGFPPDDKTAQQQQHRGGGGFGFHFRHQQQQRAQPIESVSKQLTVEELVRLQHYRGEGIAVIQLYHDQCYECRMWGMVWETIVKSRLKHYIQFYRLNVMTQHEEFHRLGVSYGGSGGSPRMVAMVDGTPMTMRLPDDLLRPHNTAAGIAATKEWIDGLLVDAERKIQHLGDSAQEVVAWSQTLKAREVGLLVFPAVPDDESLLRSFAARIPQRTRRIATIDSRKAVLTFLRQCPQLSNALPSVASEATVKELVLVFNASSPCDATLITSRKGLRSEQVLSAVGHRAIPPLAYGTCGRGKDQHAMCIVWIRTNGAGAVESIDRAASSWAGRLAQNIDQFRLLHVDHAEEPAFVDQLSLTEKGPEAVAAKPHDIVLLVYIASLPGKYGVIRLRNDSHLLDRIESKVPSMLARFLHGYRLHSVDGSGDVMNTLVVPVFPLQAWRPWLWWLQEFSTVSSMIGLGLMWWVVKAIFGAGENNNNSRQQQQQQRRPPRSPEPAHRPATPPVPPSSRRAGGSHTTAGGTRPAPAPAAAAAEHYGGNLLLSRHDFSASAEGFLIMMFVPQGGTVQSQPSQRVLPSAVIPMHLRMLPKLRFRVVKGTHHHWWAWFRTTAARSDYTIPSDEVSFVAVRMKKRTAVIKPSARDLDRWIESILDGTTTPTLPVPASVASAENID